MSEFKIGDIVRVIADEDCYFKAGEICEVMYNDWDDIDYVWLQSQNPSYENGKWSTHFSNIELVEAYDVPLEDPHKPYDMGPNFEYKAPTSDPKTVSEDNLEYQIIELKRANMELSVIVKYLEGRLEK